MKAWNHDGLDLDERNFLLLEAIEERLRLIHRLLVVLVVVPFVLVIAAGINYASQ